MSRIGTAAEEPLDTCIRCGNDTKRAENGNNNRHTIQLYDYPRGEKWNSIWGSLCPRCWREVWRYVAGKEPEHYGEETQQVELDSLVQNSTWG